MKSIEDIDKIFNDKINETERAIKEATALQEATKHVYTDSD